MPQTCMNIKNRDYDSLPDVVAWDDSRYGRCRVVAVHHEFIMLSEHDPNNPRTHRLEIRDARPEMIRLFAQELFGLVVPAWC